MAVRQICHRELEYSASEQRVDFSRAPEKMDEVATFAHLFDRTGKDDVFPVPQKAEMPKHSFFVRLRNRDGQLVSSAAKRRERFFERPRLCSTGRDGGESKA
jgi:hypothetical protein